jgi:putative heme iron utilization protein
MSAHKENRTLKTTAVFAALAAACALSPAMADPLPVGYSPGFTAAKLSTHTVAVNKDVSLSVTGMGLCKNFKINWGDSSEVVAEFDFGYGASLATLTKIHQYTKGDD